MPQDLTRCRNVVRQVIGTAASPNLGSSATHYPLSSATRADNNEGDNIVTSWGTGVGIKVMVPGNSFEFLKNEKQFREENGVLRLVARDDVTISKGDRIDWQSAKYEVNDIEKFFVQDVLVAQEVVLNKDADL